MLAATADFERYALNRITFGARDEDVAAAQQMGWVAWVADQLNPPPGDDPALAAHIAQLGMRIVYGGQASAPGIPGWAPVNQFRPLTYLSADTATLWDIARRSDISVAPNERTRIQQEVNAVTWVRNVHSHYQLREFMADFWNNHFSIGRQEDIYATAALPIYDSQVIRPRVFGNFLDLLTAVAQSASMLRFLNNSESTAAHPNENYARELMELHTLGAPAYLGLTQPASMTSENIGGLPVAPGFTDDDVIQASRALSGWTLEEGQQGLSGTLPFTGNFTFNYLQHNPTAGTFLGVDLRRLAPIQQGKMVLYIVAHHPATADFIVRKLARRIFGDNAPESAITRGKVAWTANADQPDQIKQVVSAIVTGGPEIGAPPSKVRRPHERIMALLRTTDTVVNAYDQAYTAVETLGDGIYVWGTPEGRPDHDSQWLTAAANLVIWNQLLQILSQPAFMTTLTSQTPPELATSATGLVEFWVERLVGYALRPAAMNALVNEALTPIGVVAAYRSGGINNIETALRRMVGLIGASPEFALR